MYYLGICHASSHHISCLHSKHYLQAQTTNIGYSDFLNLFTPKHPRKSYLQHYHTVSPSQNFLSSFWICRTEIGNFIKTETQRELGLDQKKSLHYQGFENGKTDRLKHTQTFVDRFLMASTRRHSSSCDGVLNCCPCLGRLKS